MKNYFFSSLLFFVVCGIGIPVSRSYLTENNRPLLMQAPAAPNVALLSIHPADNAGSIIYLTCAPRTSKEKLSALLSVKFTIKNNESQTLILNKIVYECTGNGVQISRTFFPDDDKKDTIKSGKSYGWQNRRPYQELGDVLLLPSPFPTQLSIKLFFDGHSAPFNITKSLKGYQNATAYSFPAKEQDLGLNEYWYADASHGGGHQVFSYDIIVRGWDPEGKKWSDKYPGTKGDKNEHYRCFGKPVYALADGEVVHFNDQIKDNEPGVDTDGGGNTFQIKTGNEIIRYFHLKQFSLNKDFMKVGAKVKRGDFLARVGSTATASAHLHIDCIPADGKSEVALPLQFSNACVIDENKMKEPDPGADWAKMNKTGIPYIESGRCYIWPDNKPTWYPGGWGEIGRHGIPGHEYQNEFNKIWSSGYYPIWVDAYDVNGKTFFNAIFRYNKNNYDVAVKHGLTANAYQQEYDKWVKKEGFRLLQLESYPDNGQVKWAAVFIKKPDLPQQQPAYHGISPQEHQKQFEELTGKGFVTVNVSVASVNGKRFYSAFYEKRNVGGCLLKSTLTQQQYQDMFDEMAKKGWDQVYINAYEWEGATRFSVIWYEKANFKSLTATRKSSSESYQEKYEDNLSKGMLTRCVTGYDEGNKHWFAAHWAK